MLETKNANENTSKKSVNQKEEETSKDLVNKVKNVSSSLVKKEPTILTEQELSLLDYADFSTPARMMALAEILCKSSLSPLKKKEDVVMALMTGQELGLPFITSLSQIYPINNRPTLGVHIQKAILLKNGIVIEKIEDAITIYEFYKAGEDGRTLLKEVKKEGKVIKVPVLILGLGTIKEQPKNSTKKPKDTRTTYKFTRELLLPSGKYKEVTAKGSFSLSEASEAGLADKDVWIKYWRRMLDARAFTNGAREIGDDLLLGISSPNELSNDFYINENKEEVYIPTIEQQEN